MKTTVTPTFTLHERHSMTKKVKKVHINYKRTTTVLALVQQEIMTIFKCLLQNFHSHTLIKR
jgi:hypothetical protein